MLLSILHYHVLLITYQSVLFYLIVWTVRLSGILQMQHLFSFLVIHKLLMQFKTQSWLEKIHLSVTVHMTCQLPFWWYRHTGNHFFRYRDWLITGLTCPVDLTLGHTLPNLPSYLQVTTLLNVDYLYKLDGLYSEFELLKKITACSKEVMEHWICCRLERSDLHLRLLK